MGAFLLLAVVAGLLAVDHRAGWHSLLAHPVFTAFLVGCLFGEPTGAFAVGVSLELVYLSILPMRGSKLPDQVAAGVVGAGTSVLLLRHGSEGSDLVVCSMGIFLGLVAGEVGARIVAPFLSIHNRFLGGLEFSSQGDARALKRRLGWVYAGSLVYLFVIEGLTMLLMIPVAYYVAERSTRIVHASLERGAGVWSSLVAAILAVSVIHLFWQHRFRVVLAACAAAAVVILWLV